MTTPPPVVLPGQRLTANRLNSGLLIGRLVFSAYRDAAQSISHTTVGETANALSWDNIAVDLLGGWSAAQPTRYRPPIAGWYQCVGSASIQAPAGGSDPLGTMRGCSWRLNGGLPPSATSRPIASTAIARTYMTMQATDLPLSCNGSSDYIELCPFQDSTLVLPTATGSVRPSIAIYYAGPTT